MDSPRRPIFRGPTSWSERRKRSGCIRAPVADFAIAVHAGLHVADHHQFPRLRAAQSGVRRVDRYVHTGRTWAATLLAKYVPGGVWHVVGRGLLLARSGVSARITASVGITEQCLSLGLCGLISVAFLCFALDLPWWAFALVVLGAIAMVVLPAPLLRWMHQSVRADLYRRALLGYFVGMIPYTLGYFVIVAPDLPVRFVGALFAGTVAGVLAILAPGGLGIRESATSLIAPSAQPAQLLAGLLAARALIIVVEILVSVVCMRLLRARTTR